MTFRLVDAQNACMALYPEWCASFFFGSSDPRAKKNVWGSLVAGITGYRAAQEYRTAIEEGDDQKASIKAAELALMATPFGLGMMGKFSVAATRVAATDAALSGKLLADQSAAIRAGDLSATTLGNHVRLIEFGAGNAALRTDMRLIRVSSSAPEFRALAEAPSSAAEMAQSIRVAVAGSEAETVQVLSRIRSGEITGETGAASLDANGKLTAAMRNEATRRGKAGDQMAGEVWIGLDSMVEKQVAGRDKLTNTLKAVVPRQPVMGYGSMGEAIQGGRIARGEYSLLLDDGTLVPLSLEEVSLGEIQVTVDGAVYKAKFDALVKLPDGRGIFTEIKYGPTTAEGKASLYD